MAKPTGADARDPLATLQSRVGFMGGIFLSVELSRVLSIQSEVLYTMKGATYIANDDTYTDKLYADYIEVPMLLKLRIPTPVVQPFIFGARPWASSSGEAPVQRREVLTKRSSRTTITAPSSGRG
jgi:hypothetical protein